MPPSSRIESNRTRHGILLLVIGSTLVLFLGPPLAGAALTDPTTTVGAAAGQTTAFSGTGPVVTLNGTPIDTDEGHRLEGCTIETDVTGLLADENSPVSVRVVISAIAPTVPEHTSQVLVDDTGTAIGPTWEQDYDMTALLASFEPRPNGYRLSVEVELNGDGAGEKQVWLACGQAQEGRPSRILFDVVWLGVDGEPVKLPLDDLLPASWRDAYSLQASSDRGSAACGYEEGSDTLGCTYDNPGHGTKPGLVVPGGRHHTYDVEQFGLAEGWRVDPSTVGTFLGRDTCPKGGCDGDEGSPDHGGGCDGDHTDTSAAIENDEGETERTCTHVVVNRQLPPPVEPPEGPETPEEPEVQPSTVEPTPTTSPTQVLTTTELPRTGTDIWSLVALALTLLTAGAIFTGLRRLRVTNTIPHPPTPPQERTGT